jgi:hypothetical protein
MTNFRATYLALAGSLLLLTAGCKSKPIDDATLNTNVHNALAADTVIAQQPIQTTTVSGVVTLTGNVTDDTASTVAANDAAKVKGVKEVVNNLTVNGVDVTPTVTSSAAPANPRPATPQEQTAIANNQPLPPPPANEPPPPPQPVVHTITVPDGTPISIRITESLDSQHSETGQPFNGVVTHAVVRNGYVVIPGGSAVSGRVVDAKDAGHYKGNSILSIQLTALRRHGQLIPIHTDTYTLEGKGRGKNSVAKIGGGAAIGAVLGGIFGGGKGAAIGAGVGGGSGAAYQGFTRGEQVSISSETVLRFRLTSSFTVQTTDVAGSNEPTAGLQPR